MNRHEILGRNLHVSLDECLSVLAKGEERYLKRTAPGRPQQQFDRVSRINKTVMHAVLEHLGYGPILNLRAELDLGLDRCVEYFCTDWWAGNEYDAVRLDKSRPDRQLAWIEMLSHSLLIGGLTGRWDDVARICSWFDASIEAEYQGGLIEDEYMQLFLCIAAGLRPEPMRGVEEILANVKNCRPKCPRLLGAAWETAIAKDQHAFDAAFKETVSHFLKHEAHDVPNVNFWVARDASIIWLIAETNGLQFPALPEKLDAAVLRRQTVGLA